MSTMSMSVGEKIRVIREAEQLTRDEFGELLGIPVGSLKRYETGRIGNVGSDVLLKITQHQQFKKYTMWLMTGDVAPEIGQISPDLSPDGPESTSANQKDQKVG